MAIFPLLVELVHWLMEAAIRYNSTPEGEAGLVDILDGLEALGIDVPFFEPTPKGSPLNMQDAPVDTSIQDKMQSAAFRARHPELFPTEAQT